MKPIVRVLCVLFVSAALPAIAFGEGPKFQTVLEGGQEVPPVITSTVGTFEVQFNDDLTDADFELKVLNGTKVLQAHLHCAPAGVNGPVFAFLFGLVPGGFDVNGDPRGVHPDRGQHHRGGLVADGMPGLHRHGDHQPRRHRHGGPAGKDLRQRSHGRISRRGGPRAARGGLSTREQIGSAG